MLRRILFTVFQLDDFLFREDARDDFSFDQLRIKIPQVSIVCIWQQIPKHVFSNIHNLSLILCVRVSTYVCFLQ